jgi:hypothetical protein
LAGADEGLPKQVADGLRRLTTTVATATQCVEKGDVWAHFATLRTMREDLASMGRSPIEDDFYVIVIGSLPPSYDPYVSALNATQVFLALSYLRMI